MSITSELRREHDALLARIQDLDAAGLERDSYADGWSIAQVLSHLGSGAEINLSNLRAALEGSEPIPKGSYPELWARWDGYPPIDKADGFRRYHGDLVALLEDVGEEGLAKLDVPTAMGVLPGTAVAGMRFREAALHGWDVAVALDPEAKLTSEASEILADQLPGMIGRLADPEAAARVGTISLRGRHPDIAFVFEGGPPVELRPEESGDEPMVTLPAEALVRLLYGRLDPAHEGGDIEERPDGSLDRLVAVFRGF